MARDLKLPLKKANNGKKDTISEEHNSGRCLSAGAKRATSVASFKLYL